MAMHLILHHRLAKIRRKWKARWSWWRWLCRRPMAPPLQLLHSMWLPSRVKILNIIELERTKWAQTCRCWNLASKAQILMALSFQRFQRKLIWRTPPLRRSWSIRQLCSLYSKLTMEMKVRSRFGCQRLTQTSVLSTNLTRRAAYLRKLRCLRSNKLKLINTCRIRRTW